MYIPDHFAIKDPDALCRIIQNHPLGVLVTPSPDGLDANHIPFEFDAAKGAFGLLTGHVARANPVWQQCVDGADVLVIFRGSESYISPNWYPSKHAHGRLTVQDQDKYVRGVAARLTWTHEASEPVPWKMGHSAPEYIQGMLQAIVGIEITITRLEGKAKLGQNREMKDRLNAADVLSTHGETELSEAMRSAAS